MFRIVAVSVNGGESRTGPEFITPTDAQNYVVREFRSVTSYWQVWIENSDGERVWRGYRNGYNGTGELWVWELVP